MTQPSNNQHVMSLDAARDRLASARGRRFWRTLEELAGDGKFQAMLQREFPRQAAVADWDPIDRRDFMRLMGASLAMAGLTACTKQPEERIVPYVTQPENMVPGKPLFFATALTLAGYGYGLLAESHMGRPTKVEGNPEHPASLGGSDLFAQASILEMYDPDRSQVFIRRGRVSTWDQFLAELSRALETLVAKQGDGLRILSGTVTSPTLAAQFKALMQQMPKVRWHQYEPFHRDAVREGAKLAFGEALAVQYRFDRAKIVLSLDGDFLMWDPGHVRYARDFAGKRDAGADGQAMNRLYVVESTTSITGTSADHRLAVKPSAVEAAARLFARELGIEAAPPADTGLDMEWIKAAARDLKRHRGETLVVAGIQQPPIVHALAHAMNDALDALGRTVVLTEPVEASPVNQLQSLRDLVADMNAGKVELLLMLGANPVFDAPADLRFAEALDKVALRVHHGLFENETSFLCQWHVPETHFLEAWSDVRCYDGTASIVQPLIQPLYGAKSVHELINVLLGKSAASGYDTVRETWKVKGGADFEAFWRRAVHDGVVPGTAAAARTPALKPGFASTAPSALPGEGDLEISLLPDYSIFDGRFANNGWLQEVPRPVSKIVWDNALLVSPATAAARGWKQGQVVTLSAAGQTLDVAVFPLPGHPDDCATLHAGYGRARAGKSGTGVGFNAYALVSSAAGPLFRAAATSTARAYELVVTQQHHSVEGRGHLRVGTVEEYRHDPHFANGHAYEHFKGADPFTIYKPDVDLSQGVQWGMAINLGACIGCNACILACQAENNIPVVGKDQVRRNREMQWIRIDHYYEGDPAKPVSHHQPVTCMHCEYAPCEAVCPVAATVHSNDGLNQMIYNRCVGTRYCSNNCPYKVRRFNFYKFADHTTPSLQLQRNPDVTVRARGVMEKCTYCVQRISEARIEAKKEGRGIRDGDVVTACQQACPTRAITFGDINDAGSAVARLRAGPLHYGMLRELNTRPRTTYLAKVMNPNPELGGAFVPHGADEHGGQEGHGES